MHSANTAADASRRPSVSVFETATQNGQATASSDIARVAAMAIKSGADHGGKKRSDISFVLETGNAGASWSREVEFTVLHVLQEAFELRRTLLGLAREPMHWEPIPGARDLVIVCMCNVNARTPSTLADGVLAF
jgi:hypothetical protein